MTTWRTTGDKPDVRPVMEVPKPAVSTGHHAVETEGNRSISRRFGSIHFSHRTATVFLACGIPVLWVEATPSRPAPGVYRYGWTETREIDWASSAPLSEDVKILRRILGKAGGVAGEAEAREFDVSMAGAEDDLKQIGAGLTSSYGFSKPISCAVSSGSRQRSPRSHVETTHEPNQNLCCGFTVLVVPSKIALNSNFPASRSPCSSVTR
jgi:hypothetical protein